MRGTGAEDGARSADRALIMRLRITVGHMRPLHVPKATGGLQVGALRVSIKDTFLWLQCGGCIGERKAGDRGGSGS